MYEGYGVKRDVEPKDFASGEVVRVYNNAQYVRVRWYWSVYRNQHEDGRYTFVPTQVTVETDEWVSGLVLMSVPDHDHWPFNRWVKVAEVIKEARAQKREACAKMLERWIRGDVDDKVIQDCREFCADIEVNHGLEADLQLFVRAEKAAGIE